MQKSDCIIGVEHVSKYFGDKAVLNDVNLSVRKGEFVTILGPSGCGKTTLLRLIAGFQTASKGIITIAGKDITQTPPHQRPVNTVFQKYALFPHLNVYNNIAFGLKLKKMPEATIGKKVKQALRMVGMTDYEDRDVDSLSGGQQQRVAIARAIVNEPEVLLLDEPLAALDLKMRKDMQMELKEMHQKLGITFVYVTHDQEEIVSRCNGDTLLLRSELEKLCACADGGTITREMIQDLVLPTVSATTFSLAGAVVQQRATAAMQALEQLFTMRVERPVLLAALNSAFLDLYRAAAAVRNHIPQVDMKQDFGYRFDFQVRNAYRDCSRIPIARIRACLAILRDLEQTCNSTAIPERTAIETAIVKMLTMPEKQEDSL